jgi:hypothetical protein
MLERSSVLHVPLLHLFNPAVAAVCEFNTSACRFSGCPDPCGDCTAYCQLAITAAGAAAAGAAAVLAGVCSVCKTPAG